MIFYFSGTGNSLHAAKRISAHQNERLISISDCLKARTLEFKLAGNEIAGFIFPTYFFGIPTIVLDFMKRLTLRSSGENYIFAACTCGGDSGNLLKDFAGILKKKGLALNAGFEIVMPDNYILMFNLLTPPERVGKILTDAEVRIGQINSAVSGRKDVKPAGGFSPWIKTVTGYPVYKFGRSTKPFHTADNCTGCGLCAKKCPCGMIHLKNKRPVWASGKCTQCIACLHRCPVSAIQYGKKTATRGRYVHPDLR
jgi:ferredoxin/flavodoxin